MEHTMEAYLKNLPTEKLDAFLQDYIDKKLIEDYSDMIGEVVKELSQRTDSEKKAGSLSR